MTLKEFRIFITLLSIGLIGMSQTVMKGVVTDVNGQPIINAAIYIDSQLSGSSTDIDGKFNIELEGQTEILLNVFAYNYELYEQNIKVEQGKSLSIVLLPITEGLSEVVLNARRDRVFALQNLRTVEGTAIYAGKKTEVVLLDQITANTAANNARQIYSQVVGLNIYENGDAGLQLNIGGRGLDPNRTANFNVRQNGYDISADALGYPESYYTPTAEALERIQLIRGAASLQYGSQFGGLLNFVMKKPNPDKKFELVSRQTLGSYNLFTSFNSVSGTVGKLGYYSYFNYKQGDGFRPNSEFDSRNYFAHIDYQFSKQTKLAFELTLFNYLAKQAGGLTDQQFYEDPNFSNRSRNWFNVDWRLYSLKLEHAFSDKTDFSLSLFGLDATRKALGFRVNRVSQADDPNEPRELLVDDFNNWGAESRLLTRYNVFSKDAVFLIGAKYYQSKNNQQQGPGSAAADANFSFASSEYPNYARQSEFEMPNLNLALFSENIFNITSDFSVTPGIRYEYIKTESIGSYKDIQLDLAGNPIRNEDIQDNRELERQFVLLGIGLSYKPSNISEFYGNFSQNYRSVTFNDIRVVNPSFQIDENIEDESGFTTDIGYRGRYRRILNYDASLFALSYDNRLGEVLKSEEVLNAQGELVETGRTIRLRGNIGDAIIYGVETFVDWSIANTFFDHKENYKLNVFSNLAVTSSKYLSSERNNVKGNRVEFIPAVNFKTGIKLGYKDFLASIQYSYLSEQFTDATNAPQDKTDNQRGIEGTIPSYGIMDVSLSYTYNQWKLEAGVNNLLNRDYFVRRATGYPGPGIIPSEPLSFYTTLQFKL